MRQPSGKESAGLASFTENNMKIISTLTIAFFLLVLVSCEKDHHRKPVTTCSVVAYTAGWCGPCRASYPLLIAIRAGGVSVRIVDIDTHREEARRAGITSVPTFIVKVGSKSLRTHSIVAVQVFIHKGRK